MNKEEAIIQLHELNLDWEENGLDTKLNQTDINAIKILVSELDIANKKIEEIEKYIKENACYSETKKECLCSFSSMALDKILEIIGGEEVSNE